MLIGYGFRQEDICKLIINPETDKPITKPTLERHFRKEIDTGALLANALVAESLFNQAVGRAKLIEIQEDGTKVILKERVEADKGAAIWWSKARMGWSETRRLSGPDGGPIQFEEKTDARERVARKLRRLIAAQEADRDDGSPCGE